VVTAKDSILESEGEAIPTLYHGLVFEDRIDMEFKALTSPTVYNRLSDRLATLRQNARFIRVLVDEGFIDPTCTEPEAVQAARRDISVAALVWRSASNFFLPFTDPGANRHVS
jgi:hypothetical protein